MSPDELQPAIARLLMLTASVDDAEQLPDIRDALQAFVDDDDALVALAVQAAADAAQRITTLPPTALGGFYIGRTADVVAFSMIGHAEQHGTDGLADHIDYLPTVAILAVAVGVLTMRGQVCSVQAGRILADLQLPDTAPTREDR